MQALRSITQQNCGEQSNGSVRFRTDDLHRTSRVRLVYYLRSDHDKNSIDEITQVLRLSVSRVNGAFMTEERLHASRRLCATYRPMYEVVTEGNLDTIVYAVLDCLHHLRYDLQILHRNVGAHTIMCEKRGDSLHVTLTDFSRACRVSENGELIEGLIQWPLLEPERSQALEAQQSFTEEWHNPFRAQQVAYLSTSPHRLWHDYRSLFYATAWCACPPRGLYRRRLFPWEFNPEYEDLLHTLVPLPTFACYRPWLLAYGELLQEGSKLLRKLGDTSSMHEQETAGGILTAKAIKEKLQAMRLVEVGESD